MPEKALNVLLANAKSKEKNNRNEKGRDIGCALAANCLRGSQQRGSTHHHSPLMRSLLSQSQTPTGPRRASRIFRVWLPGRLPYRADHSIYFGLANFI